MTQGLTKSMDVGFYGKLPSHGDFLRRRLPDTFVGPWDAWLQEAMRASRSLLGDEWLDVYLTSPAWRFVCAPDACGQVGVMGILVPSVDGVGRYFPLTLAVEIPAAVDLVAAAVEGAAFFDAAERLLVDTLEAERVDLEAFDARVVRLGDELAALRVPRSVTLEPAATTAVLGGVREGRWRLPIGRTDRLSSVLLQMVSQQLADGYAPLVLWWTDGSRIVEPSCLIAQGLPSPDAFAALLDGVWERQWQSVPARIDRRWLTDTLAGSAGEPMCFRSTAATDAGRVRATNQDAFVERREIGLWAVADGLGGHRDGEVASRMVCDALADVAPGSSLDETVAAAAGRLHEVNAHLHGVSSRDDRSDVCSSTVVALVARGARAVVLWAGDSRAYRLRGGLLQQLTADHSAAAGESSAVTRAVGARIVLDLDVARADVRDADRFLLCSDGLTRFVPEAQIQICLSQSDMNEAIDDLMQSALDAGAPDNVTVVLVDADGSTT